MISATLLALILAIALAGCGGNGGPSVALKPDGCGGFAPAKINLSTEMQTVSLSFRAEQITDPAAAGKWNSYDVTLVRAGDPFKRVSSFNFNYDGSADGQPGAPYQTQVFMIVRLQPDDGGEYELVIKPTSTAEVKLQNPQIDLRTNVINTNERLSRKKRIGDANETPPTPPAPQ